MAEDAEAITLRARLGFETGKAWNTSLLAEGDLLWPLETHYNSTVNGKTAYPVVADAETYEINRLQLTNTSLAGHDAHARAPAHQPRRPALRRQRGLAAERADFDGLRVVNKSVREPDGRRHLLRPGESRVRQGFAGRAIQRVELPCERGVSDAHRQADRLCLSDWISRKRRAIRLETLGLRFTGEQPVSKIKLAWLASFARQTERANNPLSLRRRLLHGWSSPARSASTASASGVEVLEGNGVRGFTTPLATLHKFDGWADKFLTTPPNGLERRYATLGYTKKGLGVLDTLTANAVYHQFDSNRLSIDYGSEVDLQLQAKYRRFNVLLKYADYNADSFATDTDKYWLQVDYVW